MWEAIQHYLTLAGRPWPMDDDEPLFVATVSNGSFLRQFHGKAEPSFATPLTGEACEQSLKRYAKAAGIDPAEVSLHSLRHLGAELFNDANGGDVAETQKFLDHSNLNTTQIYLTQLKGEEHKHWQAMADELGL